MSTDTAEKNVTTLPAVEQSATGEIQVGTADMLFQGDMMSRLEHFAVQMAKGKATIPQHLQGSPADCMAVVMQAAQWRMNPFAVAQKTHVVNGTLGYEAQLVNAVVSSSKAITGRFKYEWDGEGQSLSCRVGAVIRGENAITWGEPVVLSTVLTKNSPLWKSQPKQQLAYLALKYWARLYTPDVIMGVYTQDELEEIPEYLDMGDIERGKPETRTDSLKDKIKAQAGKETPPIAESVDQETGEVITDKSQDTPQQGMTAGDVLNAIDTAQSVDEVNEALDFSRELKLESGEKQSITRAAGRRVKELNGM